MSEDFILKVGVEADTSNVQKQIDKKKDITVKVATKIDINDKLIQRELERIKSSTKEKLGIEIDDKQALKAFNNIQKGYNEVKKELYQSIGQKPQVFVDMAKYYAELELESQKKNKLIQQEFLDSRKEAYQSIGQKPKIFSDMAKYFQELEIESQKSTKAIQDDFVLLRKEMYQSIGQKSPELTKMANYYKELEQQLGNTAKAQKELNNLNLSKQGSLNSIDTFVNKNTKLNTRSAQELKQKILEIRQAIDTTDDSVALKNLQKQFVNAKKEAEALGHTGKTLGDELTNNFKKFSNWVGVSAIFFGVQRAFKSMVDDVIDIDTAMTSLKKVTDATDSSFEKFLNNTAKSAKELGSSISDIVNSTAEFARLGYSLPDAEELGKVATLYKNVGDGISATQASQSIISTMKAFNIQASDSIEIIDKFNQIGNKFSISTAGIGDALQRSASALAEANNDLSQSIALQVGANNVIQDPDVVGTMWKTVAMRIRGAKLELEEAGLETDGILESTAKLRDLVKQSTGFDIMLDEDTFKSTYDIIVGIGREWNKLTDINQASLLNALAGQRQGNALASALNNIKDIEAAYKSAEESAGSALREQQEYEKSIQYSLDRLGASLQEMSLLTINDGLTKGLVDLTSGIINLINTMGGLAPILTVVGGIFVAWKTGILPTLIGQIQMLILAQTDYTASTVTAALAQAGLAGAIKATIVAIKAFLLTNPVGWAILASSAIFIATKAVDLFTISLEEAQQAYSETKTELESVNSELETTSKRIDELLSKDNLTFVEKDELSNLQKSNAELERRKQLLEDELKLKSQDLNNKLYSEHNKDYGYNYNRSANLYSDYASDDSTTISKGRSNAQLITEEEYFKRVVKRYQELDKLGEKRSKADEKEYTELNKYLVETGKNFQENADQIVATDETSKNFKQTLSELADLAYKALHPDLWKNNKLTDYLNSDDLKETKKELIELAQAGKLDETTLSKYPKFKAELDKLGISANEVAEHINGLVQESENLNGVTLNRDYTQEILDANKEVKKFSDNIKGLASVYQSLNNKEDISIDNITSLIEKYPEYSSELININNSREDGIILINKLLEKEKEEAINSLTDIQAKIEGERLLQEEKKETLRLTSTLLGSTLLNNPFKTNGQILNDANIETFKVGDNVYTAKEYKDIIDKNIELANKKNDAIQRIEELKELLNKPISEYDKKNGSSSKDTWKEAFQAEYNYIQYLRGSDQLNAQQYYDKLNALNQKYFANRKKYLDEYRQYDLELYKLDQEIAQDRISDKEHTLQLKVNAYGDEATKGEQIRVYTEIQDELHRLANEARKRGISDNDSMIQQLQDKWWQYENKKFDITKQFQDKQKSLLEKQISAAEKIHDLTLSMLKKEMELQRDSHKDKIDAIKEEFDLKRSLLDDELDDYNYNKNLQEKVNAANKIQGQIDLIKNDETQKSKLAQLEDELKKAMDDLNDFQYEHSIDSQKKILDEQEKLITHKHQAEIDSIDKKLNDEVYMRELADERIKKSGYKLYNELMKFSEDYGTVSKREVNEVWKAYETVLENFNISQNGLTSTLDTLYDKLTSIKDLLEEMGNMSLGEFSSSQINGKQSIIDEMKSNQSAWHTSSSTQQSNLSNMNNKLAQKLYDQYGIRLERRSDGHWYNKDTGELVLHTGGVVSKDSNNKFKSIGDLKSDEVRTILQDGEVVFAKGGVPEFIKNISGINNIAEKLSKFTMPKLDNFELNKSFGEIVFADNGVYNLNGIDDASLIKFKTAKAEVINEAVKKISDLMKNNGGNRFNMKGRT